MWVAVGLAGLALVLSTWQSDRTQERRLRYIADRKRVDEELEAQQRRYQAMHGLEEAREYLARMNTRLVMSGKQPVESLAGLLAYLTEVEQSSEEAVQFKSEQLRLLRSERPEQAVLWPVAQLLATPQQRQHRQAHAGQPKVLSDPEDRP